MKMASLKKRGRIYGIYTILFFVTALLAFASFWVQNKVFIWTPDGLLQDYHIIAMLKRIIGGLLKGNFAFWTWSAGLGGDTIGNFAFVLFDPFTWFAALFPEQYLDIGYTISILLKLYFSGISMMVFLRYLGKRDSLCIMAGLGYGFSNWAVGSIVHSFFLDSLLLFPLIILGIEKAEKEKKVFLLIVSVFFSLVTSVYFSYMTAILVGIYLIVYYVVRYREKSLKIGISFFAKYIGLVLISLCLSAIVVFPAVFTLIMAPKSTGNAAQIFHSISSYINYLPSLINNTQVYGNYSYMGTAALFIIAIPCFFHKIKNKTASVFVWMCGIVFLINLLPVFGSLLNGFSYVSGRWCYAFAFFLIVSAVEVLESSEVRDSAYRKQVHVFLAVLGIIMFVIGKLCLGLGSVQSVFIGFLNIFFGVLFAEVLSGNKKNRGAKMALLLVLNLILLYNTEFSNRVSANLDTNFKYQGELHNRLQKSPQKAAAKIEDNGFYRVDQVEGMNNSSVLPKVVRTPANENLYFGTNTLYTYLSTIDSRVYEYNKQLCNAGGYYRRICTFSNDNRARLDFLDGVKYFLGTSKHGTPNTSSYAAYGFEEYDKKFGTSILKTDYFTGLGFVYYDVMSRKEFEKLDYLQREQVIMETAVLEDVKEAGSIPERTALEAGEQGVKQVYEYVQKKNVKTEGNAFLVSEDNGSVTLSLDALEDAELYFFFKNLKRLPYNAEDAGKADTVKEKIRDLPEMMQQPDSGEFSLTVSDGTKEKKCLNPLNENQAFDDIEDFLVNLGYYENFNKKVTITFSKAGKYVYDDFSVISVPVESFKKQAAEDMESAFQTETVNGNYINGTVNCKKDGLLYLSITEHPGWKVFVDGRRVKDVCVTNYAFMGIPLAAGMHKVELRYRPVGFYPALVLFGIGAVCMIILFILGKRKGRQTHEE